MNKKSSVAEAAAMPVGLRRYLYFTAAITGGCIMIVEILGAKMLAPYLGTSHFVWTAQIAITMVSLAVGYYAGGRVVDASPRLNLLYGCIVAAAIYLCLTLLVVESVTLWCLRFKLAMGALLASAFLFFIPLSLLAMVGPFFVRVLTVSVGGVGGNVGRLTAVSTLGSFAGTVLIGYVLIPLLPNSVTMYGTGGVLLAVSLAYFGLWGKQAAVMALVAGLLGLGAGYGGVRMDLNHEYSDMEELVSLNSEFGKLQVMQEKDSSGRLYLNDYLIQNTYDVLERKSMSMFTYMLHLLPRAYCPQITDALCIGLGVGIVPMEFAREGVRVDAVEINPAVVPLAQEYFGFEPGLLNLTIGDGRYFVNQSRKQYDVVVLDAFLGDSSPSHLMTREAFESMRGVLRPEGVLVINCFGDFEPGKNFFLNSLNKTLGAVFATVKIHNARNGGNVFFVASMMKELKMRGVELEQIHSDARDSVRTAFYREVTADPAGGIVLTDDFNPVEFHDSGNRERFRRGLVGLMLKR